MILIFVLILIIVVVVIVTVFVVFISITRSRARPRARSVKMFEQNIIRLTEPLELLSSVCVSWVLIRVCFQRQLITKNNGQRERGRSKRVRYLAICGFDIV